MEVRRAEDCFVSAGDGVRTRHAFSFGTHFDPGNTRFGPLVAHNEETVSPGAGYDLHRHAGLDVVTWVLVGELTHADSTGRTAVTPPGVIQHLHAGAGVEHSERNEGHRQLRFLQMWLLADGPDEPAYRQVEGCELRVEAGTLRVVRLEAGHTFRLPEAADVHVSVAHGSLAQVGEGGTLRDTGGGSTVTAVAPAELLVWEMPER